jgi:hypothetical protein
MGWDYDRAAGSTQAERLNGPFGPRPARSIGPRGLCRQTPAGRTLVLLFRHQGETSTSVRGLHENTHDCHNRDWHDKSCRLRLGYKHLGTRHYLDQSSCRRSQPPGDNHPGSSGNHAGR